MWIIHRAGPSLLCVSRESQTRDGSGWLPRATVSLPVDTAQTPVTGFWALYSSLPRTCTINGNQFISVFRQTCKQTKWNERVISEHWSFCLHKSPHGTWQPEDGRRMHTGDPGVQGSFSNINTWAGDCACGGLPVPAGWSAAIPPHPPGASSTLPGVGATNSEPLV